MQTSPSHKILLKTKTALRQQQNTTSVLQQQTQTQITRQPKTILSRLSRKRRKSHPVRRTKNNQEIFYEN